MITTVIQTIETWLLPDDVAVRVAEKRLIVPWKIGIAGLVVAPFIGIIAAADEVDPSLVLTWMILNFAGFFAARYLRAWRYWLVGASSLYGMTIGLLLLGHGLPSTFPIINRYWLTDLVSPVLHPILSLLCLIVPLHLAIVHARSRLKLNKKTNYSQDKKRFSIKRLMSSLASFFFYFIVGPIAFFLYFSNLLQPQYNAERFDPITWKQSEQSNPNEAHGDKTRASMAGDLRRILLNQRPSERQVLKMLGGIPYRGSIVYRLDASGLDDCSFDVSFDQFGRLDHVGIHAH